jgi:glycerophosphoryl diester phosphodiesterase
MNNAGRSDRSCHNTHTARPSGPGSAPSYDGVVPVVIAHRTCPLDAPENSLAGVRHAAAVHAELVEVDVRETRDGVPVLSHDATLWRMARVPAPVRALSARAVAGIRLRGSDERVPTLAAALDALTDGLGMAIDIKAPGAADATLREVRARRLEDRALLWAQDAGVVRRLARTAPGVEVALLRDTSTASQHERFLDDAVANGARAVSAHWSALSTEFLAGAASCDLRVYSWCQHRDVGSLDAAVLRRLAGVVTDWPVEARTAIDRAVDAA